MDPGEGKIRGNKRGVREGKNSADVDKDVEMHGT